MCYTLPEVYRLPVRTYAAIAINAPYRWRSSSHKANLIPQSKRQDTTVIVIPCLCSFNALCSPSAEFPINKKRTRTLSHRELGSSTNCLVEHRGFEPLTSTLRTLRATNCANAPYHLYYTPDLKKINPLLKNLPSPFYIVN